MNLWLGLALVVLMILGGAALAAWLIVKCLDEWHRSR